MHRSLCVLRLSWRALVCVPGSYLHVWVVFACLGRYDPSAGMAFTFDEFYEYCESCISWPGPKTVEWGSAPGWLE